MTLTADRPINIWSPPPPTSPCPPQTARLADKIYYLLLNKLNWSFPTIQKDEGGERGAGVRSAKFVNILDKKRLLLLINLTVFVSAEISPDSEQHLCRAQQHHHLPCTHRHRVQLHELPAAVWGWPQPPGWRRRLSRAISTVCGVPTIPADHGSSLPGKI